METNKTPYLIVSDLKGNIFEIPSILMTGIAFDKPVIPNNRDIIELPDGSNFFMLPERNAIGFDLKTNKYVKIKEYNGNPVYAVGAFMAPAYMQLLRSSYSTPLGAKSLPLYCYTAIGWKEGRFFVTGMRIDNDERQDLKHFNPDLILNRSKKIKNLFPRNRLVEHLIDKCVCEYSCPAARNFVLGRWECPLPTSPYCNSRCLGCISKQPEKSKIVSSQNRINFIPDVKEIVEVGIYHLSRAERPILSFGQGCEGEPLLVGEVIEKAIKEIRKKTKRGIININTNGSRPDIVESLCKAGLDSIRVSLNSAQEDYYSRYYKPQGYSFYDVISSLLISKKHSIWTSINYLIYPGFTDNRNEVESLKSFLIKTKLNMIQTRNLNIDPELYYKNMGLSELLPDFLGMFRWTCKINEEFPWIKIGYYNPPLEEISKEKYQYKLKK